MLLLQPLHQRPAGVQRDRQIGERFKDFQKRKVTILIGRFKNVVEIANRLMVVQYQAKMDLWSIHSVSTRLGIPFCIEAFAFENQRLSGLTCFSGFCGLL